MEILLDLQDLDEAFDEREEFAELMDIEHVLMSQCAVCRSRRYRLVSVASICVCVD